MSRRRISVLALLWLAFWLAQSGAVFAASSPFGISTPDTTGPAFTGPLGGFFAWVAMWQSAFYRALTGGLMQVKDSGHAFLLLAGVSFLYGIFHAAGPGHGKAVISAYLLSSGEKVRRGVALSFAAAFVQAASAIVLVAIAAIVFSVTARSMTVATEWVEIASYALITAVGAWLLWEKTVSGGHHRHHRPHLPPEAAAHCTHQKDAHETGRTGEVRHHAHHHATGSKGGLAGAWSAIVAVGIRPCSGAIIILVFALAQGLFIAGVAATLVMAVGTGLTVAVLATLAVSARGLAVRLAGTRSGLATGLVRTIEIGAAAAVLLLGLLLLGGALATGLPR